MRLLMLTADYPPAVWSGIGVSVELQARTLTEMGFRVEVVSAAAGCRSAESAGGPIVHRLDRRRCPVDPHRFDLVHLHSLSLAELAVRMCRRFDLPLVYTAHSLLPLELGFAEPTRLTRWWCALQSSVLGRCDHAIFLSTAEHRAALCLFPGLERRSSVVPNAVDPPPAHLTTSASRGPLVYAGRFAKSKGIGLLVQFAPALLRGSRRSWVFAGGHGDAESRRSLSSLTNRFPDQCLLAGWLSKDELNRLYAQAALVLVPSRYEPFGLAALEAMRMGAPVLAAAAGGLTETVCGESGGRVVSSRDPQAWLDEARRLLEPETNDRLRREGPRYVAERFAPRPIAERMLESYRRLGVAA